METIPFLSNLRFRSSYGSCCHSTWKDGTLNLLQYEGRTGAEPGITFGTNRSFSTELTVETYCPFKACQLTAEPLV